MIEQILDLARCSTYDFRSMACPTDPLKHLFQEWVSDYRLQWAIARWLRPKRILEIGAGYGYSARAFLDACPDCAYVGIGDDGNAIAWARQITRNFHAEWIVGDSKRTERFPPGRYDLIHIGAAPDESRTLHDIRQALEHGTHVLVDGCLWSRDRFFDLSESLYRYRDLIDNCVILSGHRGAWLITTRPAPVAPSRVSSSEDLRHTYTASYYLEDCGGFAGYKRDKGLALSDRRLQTMAQLAAAPPIGRALDLGCGRGELSIHLARLGHEVTAVDYSESAIELARAATKPAAGLDSRISFQIGHVNDVELTGSYQVAVASDLIEHMTPAELDRLYARIASHLSADGMFIVHTFPNLWYYKYEHPRRVRRARALGAYLPGDPRTRYEELMHINEQSPRVLRRQLRAHFPHVLLWFCDHGLEHPEENLKRNFGRREMGSAGDLFAVAAHNPVEPRRLLAKLEMHALPKGIEVSLRAVRVPAGVPPASPFRLCIRLDNRSGFELKSRPPNPVHLSYHLYSEGGEIRVFEGRRSGIPPVPPRSGCEVEMELVAPAGPGRFRFRLTMVQEFVRWFDVPEQNTFADVWVDVG